MNLKRYFTVPANPAFADVSLLLLRFVAGLAFMFHGWGKIQNPFGWLGPDAPVPGIFQALAALSEFGGGLAWIIGLLNPLASLGIAITMAVGLALPISSEAEITNLLAINFTSSPPSIILAR